MVIFFYLITQIFSLPLGFAADAILDPNTGTPTAIVDATTQTSTQTSTQTQTQTQSQTSSEFLSDSQTLSEPSAEATPSIEISLSRSRVTVKNTEGNTIFEADYTNKSLYGERPVDGAQLVMVEGVPMLVVDLAIDQIDVFNVATGTSLSLKDVGLTEPAMTKDKSLSLEVLAQDQRGTISYRISPVLEIISTERHDFSLVQATGNDLQAVTVLPGLIHDFGSYGGGPGYQLAGVERYSSDTEFYLYNDVLVTDARKNEGAGVSFDNFGSVSKTIETGVLPEEFVVGFFQTGAAIRFEVVSVDPETGKETKGSVILNGKAMDFNTYRLTAQSFRAQGVDTQKVRILYAINPDPQRLYLHQYLAPQAGAQPIQVVDSSQKFKAIVVGQSKVAVIPTQSSLGRPGLISLRYTFYSNFYIVGLRFLSSAKGPLVEATVEGGQKVFLSITSSADPNKKISLTTRRGLLTPNQKLLLYYKDVASFYETDRTLYIENLETGNIQSYIVAAAQSFFPLHTSQLRAIARTLVNNKYVVISTNHYQLPGIGAGFNRITVLTLADGTIRTVDIPVPANTYTEDLSFISGEFLTSSQARIDFYNGTSYLVDLAKTPLDARILPAVLAGWPRAASNSNFEFGIAEKSNGEKDIFLRDRRTGELQFVTTVKPEENYETKLGPMDVNPEGTHAFVNVQRNYTGNLGYSSVVMNKGTTLLFDIAKKALVEPELINASTGQSLGKGPIPGQLLNASSYRFAGDFLLLNGTGREFTGHFFMDQYDPFVINLNSVPPRATELTIQQAIYLQAEMAFTPQGDKLVFGATQRSNNSIAIYDVATGKISYQALSNYGFGGIKAVGPDGKYVIVASLVNAVYIVPIQDLTQAAARTINLPVPSGVFAASLKKATFLDPTTVELITENGTRYVLNLNTMTLTPPVPKPVTAEVMGFYGGALPPGAKIINQVALKNSAGQTVWNIIVQLNQSTTLGVVQNQVLMIRPVGGEWVVQEVRDRDSSNALIMRSVLTYSSTASLLKIERFGPAGGLRSTILAVRSGAFWGQVPYFKFVAPSGAEFRPSVPLTTPLSKVLVLAAKAGR